MKTNGPDILNISHHRCTPNLIKNDLKEKIHVIKKRVVQEDKTVSEIYREEMLELYSKGIEYAAEIPMMSSMKSILHRHRNAAQGGEPSTAADIILSPDMTMMEDGTNFWWQILR
ncbi:hypothetical protein JTE90_027113 [Oedothorax gibbosus]|uniref:Uncharacterized protein n=1 Tax=Oedothorax gibbosus TaxID=931172 RepID=A0AAV6TUZ5_9ARAC|nr:hypothetical protein JTE90_027113 [Oedothorax gibbosus]